MLLGPISSVATFIGGCVLDDEGCSPRTKVARKVALAASCVAGLALFAWGGVCLNAEGFEFDGGGGEHE